MILAAVLILIGTLTYSTVRAQRRKHVRVAADRAEVAVWEQAVRR